VKCGQVLLVDGLLFKEVMKIQFAFVFSGRLWCSAQYEYYSDCRRQWTGRSKNSIFISAEICDTFTKIFLASEGPLLYVMELKFVLVQPPCSALI